MWAETRGTGVRVTALCPGATDTAFFDTASDSASIGRRMTPGQVVAAAFSALDRRRSTVVPGLGNRLLASSTRLASRQAVARLAERRMRPAPRPNTLADQRLADDVSDEEKTRRIVALQALQREIQTGLNAQLVGRDVDVLVDSVSRRRDTELSGRTSSNVVVNLPGPASWMGRTVTVRVGRAGPHSVWGSVGSEVDRGRLGA